MKYVVKVANKSYEVEIEDIYARPVIAHVDGQEFKVSPEDGIKLTLQKETKELASATLAKHPSTPGVDTNELTAPLPGTIIEVFVKNGDYIEAGQVILIIEAMKMKNSIRSTRAGKIMEVLVNAGQTVAHKQVLVKFAD
ncbi:MAG TPA: biotin/lipoyl-containing protein [Anaerolineales bacterium]|nr:biotin/lipoyl-containing protein [Anaerolineales bacterium]